MGVRTGVRKAARGAAIGVLAVALAACSTGGTKVGSNVTLQKALSDYFANNVSLAKAEFLAVVKQDPSDKYGWYNLGVIAEAANSNAEAATYYGHAISIDPNFEAALYNYGLVLSAERNYVAAADYLRRAVKVNENDANAHWNLGLILASEHNHQADIESRNELNRALKLKPSLINTLPLPKGGIGGSGLAGSGAKGSAPTTSTAKP